MNLYWKTTYRNKILLRSDWQFMSNKYRISKKRKDDLERELIFLQTTRNREVEDLIAEALEYGDPLHNAEYEAAKDVQRKIYGRIAEIERILSQAVIAEEKSLSDDFVAELKKLIESCGLSAKQAESYADFCRTQYDLAEQVDYGKLPDENCLETLKAAQRIAARKPEYHALQDGTIARLLRVPCDKWQAAKTAIMKCFGCSKEAVDTLFREDEEFLFLSEDSVFALADCLKTVLPDKNTAWKVFSKAALLGVDTVKSRIASVMEMLGEEFGKKVIRADAEYGEWLFWRYYSDPVGCIGYMKDCGLTPEKILAVIQEEPCILYMYKEGRRLSYGHDQERIDHIIRSYI